MASSLKVAPPNPKELLSTRDRRRRWFLIITTGAAGAGHPNKMAFRDLERFVDRLGMVDSLKAREVFDRLDTDGDGFVTMDDWDRVHALLSFDSLVRAEEHPNFCAYFKMLRTGSAMCG